MNHVHVGITTTIVIAANVIITLFVMRWVAVTWPESAIGKAMAAIN